MIFLGEINEFEHAVRCIVKRSYRSAHVTILMIHGEPIAYYEIDVVVDCDVEETNAVRNE